MDAAFTGRVGFVSDLTCQHTPDGPSEKWGVHLLTNAGPHPSPKKDRSRTLRACVSGALGEAPACSLVRVSVPTAPSSSVSPCVAEKPEAEFTE